MAAEKIEDKIGAQQGHAKEYRPGTRLEHARGNEISRTGREIPNRAVEGMDELARRDVDPDSVGADLPPEKPDFVGQNAIGGQSNR